MSNQEPEPEIPYGEVEPANYPSVMDPIVNWLDNLFTPKDD